MANDAQRKKWHEEALDARTQDLRHRLAADSAELTGEDYQRDPKKAVDAAYHSLVNSPSRPSWFTTFGIALFSIGLGMILPDSSPTWIGAGLVALGIGFAIADRTKEK